MVELGTHAATERAAVVTLDLMLWNQRARESREGVSGGSLKCNTKPNESEVP